MITWDDAETENEWKEVPEELHQTEVHTCGFLIKETDRHLLVAATYTEMEAGPDNITAYIQIPKGMVTSRKVLRR